MNGTFFAKRCAQVSFFGWQTKFGEINSWICLVRLQFKQLILNNCFLQNRGLKSTPKSIWIQRVTIFGRHGCYLATEIVYQMNWVIKVIKKLEKLCNFYSMLHYLHIIRDWCVKIVICVYIKTYPALVLKHLFDIWNGENFIYCINAESPVILPYFEWYNCLDQWNQISIWRINLDCITSKYIGNIIFILDNWIIFSINSRHEPPLVHCCTTFQINIRIN